MLPASLYVMCFLTTSVVHYHKRSHSRGKASRRRSVLSCLKGWKLPPYLLHPTKPSNCIYVKKTLEQCYLGSRNSRKVWGNVWWDKHSRVAYVINKWRAKINRKRLYNVRNPPEENLWRPLGPLLQVISEILLEKQQDKYNFLAHSNSKRFKHFLS